MSRYELKMAQTPPSKGKRLDHLRVSQGEDGGHVVEHHYAEDGMQYHKPKSHVFGKDEGMDAIAHIAKHSNIKMTPSQEEQEADGE